MPTLSIAKKRAAASDAPEGSSKGRATKVQKTGNGKKAVAKAKPTMSASEFKEKALPLHVNITHTPPSIATPDSGKTSTEDSIESSKSPSAALAETAATTGPIAPIDTGFIGNLTLLPSSFSTGSYGWKGAKRLVVELQNSDAGEDGHQEKVQVMLTINATVVGSKQAGGKSDDAGANGDAEEAEAEEPIDTQNSGD